MLKKRVRKIAGWTLGILLLFVAAILFYTTNFLPKVPLPEVNIVTSPENIERGHYLANNVIVCMDCHSTRDWQFFSGPVKPGSEGVGGEIYDKKNGASRQICRS